MNASINSIAEVWSFAYSNKTSG